MINISKAEFLEFIIIIRNINIDKYNNERLLKKNLKNLSLIFLFLKIFEIKPLNSIHARTEIVIKDIIKIYK